MRDKRRHPRVPDKNSVFVNVRPLASGEIPARSFVCTTMDISEIGVRLQCDNVLDLDTLAELRIAVHDPPASFKLMGRVSWHMAGDKPGSSYMGINFLVSDDELMKPWRDFVKAKLPEDARRQDLRKLTRDRGEMW